MELEAIKEIAKQHNIKQAKMKKAELIRAIQQSEGNESCSIPAKPPSAGRMPACGAMIA